MGHGSYICTLSLTFYFLSKSHYKNNIIHRRGADFSINNLNKYIFYIYIYIYIYKSEVVLDFNIFRHFDEQGRKNSVIIYYYLSFKFSYFSYSNTFNCLFFVLIFNFNNEPTGRAYRFVYLFIYDENRWTDCVTFHVQRHSDSGGHYKQQIMLGLGKKNIDFSFLWTNIEPFVLSQN